MLARPKRLCGSSWRSQIGRHMSGISGMMFSRVTHLGLGLDLALLQLLLLLLFHTHFGSLPCILFQEAGVGALVVCKLPILNLQMINQQLLTLLNAALDHVLRISWYCACMPHKGISFLPSFLHLQDRQLLRLASENLTLKVVPWLFTSAFEATLPA